MVVPAAAILLVLGAAACTTEHESEHARWSVSPATALLDVPVTATLNGLTSGQKITVTSTATDYDHVRWQASADFTASKAGAVSVAQPVTGGSYAGAMPMGLFTMMAPTTKTTNPIFYAPRGGYTVTLTAKRGRTTLATTTLTRQDGSRSGVTETVLTLARDGVVGRLYAPPAGSPRRAAVLAFGGSEGGESADFLASLLAAHGYPTLSLAYFKEPGLPSTLTNIPLEYFTRALTILRTQPGVDPGHVLVYGDSRGSEAALLLGADFPDLVDGVIAGVPSSVVNGNFPNTGEPAWTLRGEPVPSAPPSEFGKPAPADAPQAIIPVEDIRGPVLMICGTEDEEWPSCDYQDAIVARLRAHRFGYPVTAIRVPDAGHFVGGMAAYYSTTADALTYNGKNLGGTVQGLEEGLAQGHQALLALLATS